MTYPTTSAKPFDENGKHRLWPEGDEPFQIALEPVAKSPVESREDSEETPEEVAKREKEFARFVKRYLKAVGVGKVFERKGEHEDVDKEREKQSQ